MEVPRILLHDSKASAPQAQLIKNGLASQPRIKVVNRSWKTLLQHAFGASA
jgi:hypothetical protein